MVTQSRVDTGSGNALLLDGTKPLLAPMLTLSCHNECDGISYQQPHNCLLNRLFRRRSKKTPKLQVTGLCVRKSPVTGEFPAQRVSKAENASI